MIRRWLLLALLAAGCLSACASPDGGRWVRAGFDTACDGPEGFAAAARLNGESLDNLAWSPFGAPERGWRTYAPRIAREIGGRCGPDAATSPRAWLAGRRRTGLRGTEQCRLRCSNR